MRYRSNLVFSILIVLTIVLGSCTPSSTNSTITPTAPAVVTTSTKTLTPTSAITATPTLEPSATPRTELPASTPVFSGTSIPAGSEAISSENIQNLVQAAQWGRGSILGVAFTPDGSQFIVASAFGFAIYNTDDLHSAPTWVPFSTPINYKHLALSVDGKYLQLSTDDGTFPIMDFPSGLVVNDPPDVKWMNSNTQATPGGQISVYSPDGTKQLRSHMGPFGDEGDVIYTVREIYDPRSETLLFELTDDTTYLRYDYFRQPEGCDHDSNGLCKDGYIPDAFQPYEATFSPLGDTLTILYEGTNTFFRILRVYNVRNGKLIESVGNLDKPIQTFAYAPNGNNLLIAYVDGSIQLWDILKNKPFSSAWHFNDELTHVEFTADGKYLIIQHLNILEVRSTKDGSIRSRYDAVSYSLSPIDSNLIAIAENIVIKINKIDSAETLLSFRAHEYEIFTITFSPDGKFIASSGLDYKIKLWDAKTGNLLHNFEDTRVNAFEGGPPKEGEKEGNNMENSRIFIFDLDFIKGSNQIVGFGSWGTMMSWNINTGDTNYVVYSAPIDTSGFRTIFPDTFRVNSASQQFFIGDNTYNLENGKLIGDNKTPENLPEGCEATGGKSKDGNLIFTVGYNSKEGQVCVLDAHDHHLIQLINVIPHPNYELEVAGLALSQDGKILIIATTMGTVNVYQIAD